MRIKIQTFSQGKQSLKPSISMDGFCNFCLKALVADTDRSNLIPDTPYLNLFTCTSNLYYSLLNHSLFTIHISHSFPAVFYEFIDE